MVIINKVDRDTSNVEDVKSGIEDLICDLTENEKYLEFKVLYSSAI